MLVNESVAKANIKKWNILKTPLVGQNVTQKIYLPGLLEHLTKDWLENWEKKSYLSNEASKIPAPTSSLHNTHSFQGYVIF